MKGLNFRTSIARHWRGELPLWISLITCGLAVVLFARGLGLLAAEVESWFWSYDSYYRGLVGLSAYYAILVPIFVVWLWGAFRSAVNAYKADASVIAILSIMIVCFSAIAIATLYLLVAPAQIRDLIAAIEGDPSWGDTSVTVNSGRTIIYIKGYLKRSAAAQFGIVLSANSSVSIVDLQGDGGRVDAAMQFRDAIRARKLDTYVNSQCASACTILFLAGRNRIVGSQARIGFHAPSLGSVNDPSSIRSWVDEEVAMGVSKTFLNRAFSTPSSSIWYPSLAEMKSANVVTRIESK